MGYDDTVTKCHMIKSTRHSQAGLALVLTLLFTLVISLLVLAGMKQMHLGLKIMSQFRLQQQLFYHSESTLRGLYRQLKAGELSECIHPATAVNDFFDRNTQSKACHSNNANYEDSYVIEDLGEKSCHQPGEDEAMIFMSYRINVISRLNNAKIGLQSNVVLSKNKPQASCQAGDTRAINEEILSWREIHWS